MLEFSVETSQATLAYQRQHPRVTGAPFPSYLPEPSQPVRSGLARAPPDHPVPPSAEPRFVGGQFFGFAALAPAACFLEVLRAPGAKVRDELRGKP